MSDTYTQMHVQLVFAVKSRRNLIPESSRIIVEKYISTVISGEKCKLLAIYCNPDHIHIFFGLHPTISISDLARKIKSNSSRFINRNNISRTMFRWQDGYGAFTYSRSHVNNVIRYILNQPNHHRKQDFKDEYLNILRKFEVDYDAKRVFDE